MKSATLKGYILAALFSVFITLCAWIQVPLIIPITLQTFGIFLSLKVLGGYFGTVSVLAYILLGLMGLPVFSGFSSGIAAIGGVGGGYVTGFLLIAIIYWLFEKNLSKKLADYLGFPLGLLVCYFIGALWYSKLFLTDKGFMATFFALSLSYIIPDLIKLVLALILGGRISAHLQKIK